MMTSEESSNTGTMKALIMVDRDASWLRPLNNVFPQPLLEFANKSMLEHQLDALVDAGVRQVVIAVPYRAEEMEQEFKPYAERKGVKLIFSQETEPLGTAGPMALARKYLESDSEPFFVLNSDILCDFPFKDMVAFHKNHGGEGTIAVTKVEEPSKYGVVIYDQKGKVESFMEKPEEFVSNKINAGLYILNSKVLDRIEILPASMEKEIFPMMASSQQLYAYELKGYWIDIGKQDILTGTCLYLQAERQNSETKLKFRSEVGIVGNVLIDESVKIGSNCHVGPSVTIGKDVIIGDNVCIKRCVILRGSKIGSNTWLEDCIVGVYCKIGQMVRMEKSVVPSQNIITDNGVYVILSSHK
ncbi:unnamed protein product [Orchesella dallaii]|uniref:mannose-1-phosphate guanylyltransferase n=1 Tax=Orchesella dallaii TaxID=48710 RepID=A0ABP1PNM0_9HEXA